MFLRSNFSSFPHYFIYIHTRIYIFLTSGVKLHIHLLNVVVQFIVFLTLSTLICRGMDISKCFSESLGIRDNESRLYIYFSYRGNTKEIRTPYSGNTPGYYIFQLLGVIQKKSEPLIVEMILNKKRGRRVH